MKNKLFHSFLLTIIVIGILMGLKWLPKITIFGIELKPVDLLADIRSVSNEEEDIESKNILPVTVQGLRNYDLPIQENLMPIEDYSWNKGDPKRYVGRGMDYFYRALDKISVMNRPVRIAYFGDSFIEGDILTKDLRSLLQNRFGGSGVGFVDIASPTAEYRNSIKEVSTGWDSYAVTDKTGFEGGYQGINERYFIPKGMGQISLEGNAHMKAMHQDKWEVTTLYFKSSNHMVLLSQLNDDHVQKVNTDASLMVQQIQIRGEAKKATWLIPEGAGIFFGIGLDPLKGITVDNFSMRGSSGITLSNIPKDTLLQFASLRSYDLIVLQFGLNVANSKQSNYADYGNKIEKVIVKFAQAFPNASILIVGVGDRGERRNTVVTTMPGIKALGYQQQQIAFKTGCSFWNLYQAMGGAGSIAKMADAKPAMANKDYTHINSRGGQFIAQRLFDALMHGYEGQRKK